MRVNQNVDQAGVSRSLDDGDVLPLVLLAAEEVFELSGELVA